MQIDRPLYRAEVKATAARSTQVVSSDGVLDLTLTTPQGLGGTNGRGTNPEQLFAATYAASFLWALRFIASQDNSFLPDRTQVEASVDIGPTGRGFSIEVELRIYLPNLPRIEADALVTKAHSICPYSNAVRNNISVRLVIG